MIICFDDCKIEMSISVSMCIIIYQIYHDHFVCDDFIEWLDTRSIEVFLAMIAMLNTCFQFEESTLFLSNFLKNFNFRVYKKQ